MKIRQDEIQCSNCGLVSHSTELTCENCGEKLERKSRTIEEIKNDNRQKIEIEETNATRYENQYNLWEDIRIINHNMRISFNAPMPHKKYWVSF